jgi:hypothetical protein
MSSTIEITDAEASMRITVNGNSRFILKRHIREISVIQPSLVKLDLGAPLRNIYLEHSEVINPQTQNAEELRDVLNGMIKDDLAEIHNELNQIAISVESIDSTIFIEASIVHQVNNNTTYQGYALPGSKTSDPVWAIQKAVTDKGTTSYLWAEGNKDFDKIWDKRMELNYA